MPILMKMNAIAHASALSASGPQLDNRRVLAGLIDLIVVAAGAALILFAADALPSGSGSARDEVGSGLYLLAMAWGLYYYFACESGGGQTLGKRVMRLRVVRADGSAAGMREVGVRTILRVVDGVGLYLVGLVVMLVSGKRRQRLGDMAGGTIVVDASTAPDAPQPAPVPTVVAAPIVAAERSVPAVTLPVAEEPVVAEEPEFEPILGEDADPDPADSEPIEVAPARLDVVERPGVGTAWVEADDPAPVPEAAEQPALEPLPSEPAVEPAPEPVPAPPAPALEEEPPVVVRSVETVSAIDLVMGDVDEQQGARDRDSEDVSDPFAAPPGR